MKTLISDRDREDAVLDIYKDMDSRAINRAKDLGFRPFAMPNPPKRIRAIVHVHIASTGEVLTMADDEVCNLERTHPEELTPVPPCDIAEMETDQLLDLHHYWAAIAAHLRGKLTLLAADTRARKGTYEELQRIIKANLAMDTLNTTTGAKLTDAARKVQAESDERVVRTRAQAIEARSVFDIAEGILRSYEDVVSMLNRERMTRVESEINDGRGQYLRNRGRSSDISVPPRPAHRRRGPIKNNRGGKD
jgi:hypothetical protein